MYANEERATTRLTCTEKGKISTILTGRNVSSFYCHILKSTNFEKCDPSNRQKQMVASFSISARLTAKFEFFSKETLFLSVSF